MYLTVKNLGPIQEGKIDLSKKFYVFVGYNNSGKTYMAHLLWTIYHSLGDESFLRMFIEEHPNLHYGFIDSESIRENGFEITPDLIKELFECFAKTIQTKIFSDVLNVDKNHIVLHGFLINFEYDENEYDKKIIKEEYNSDYRLYPFGDTFTLTLTKKEDASKLIINFQVEDIEQVEGSFESYFDQSIDDIVMYSLKFIMNMFWGDSDVVESPTPFYLPANRTFYSVFYDYIVGYERHLIKGKEKRGNPPLFRNKYTLPIDILIAKMYDLNITAIMSQGYEDILNVLKQVIGGEIIAKPRKIEGISPLIEFLLKFDNTKEIEMYLSSSSVNQLSCLYLFLQYWVRLGNNFLIIDEPEENLHPANQLKLLNLLIKFANRHDNKVLITTHSPLLTEAINSHINLGCLQAKGVNVETVLQKHGLQGMIDADAGLTPENTGVYFFDGHTITEYRIDDYGVLFRDFEFVEQNVRRMNERLTEDIYHLLNKEQ